MTPVASWSPADYYQASRAARRAWERTQPQQVLFDCVGQTAPIRVTGPLVDPALHLKRAGQSVERDEPDALEDGQVKRAAGTAAACSSSSASSADSPLKDDALDSTDNGPGRITPTVLRGRGQ